jgi:hypothetical protein
LSRASPVHDTNAVGIQSVLLPSTYAKLVTSQAV